MRLGTDQYQQPGEDIEHARVFFLQIASDLDTRPLHELHTAIYPAFASGVDVGPLISDWCRRWNFMLGEAPAEWVIARVRLTLAWWKRGKPTSEQMVEGMLGGRPIEPVEWLLGVSRVGIPTILQDDQKSPFVHIATYVLDRLRGESDREYFARISKMHRGQLIALKADAKRALVLKKKKLIKTPSRPGFEDHVVWAVLFQNYSFELADLLQRVHADPRTVTKGISGVLRLVGLTRRRSTRIGRPRKEGKPGA
jgi:hypothetical protein